jgi:ATP-dependent Zn protease
MGKDISQHPFERASTIYHELGHAIVGDALKYRTDLVSFSAVSSLGYTFSLGDKAKNQVCEEDVINDAAVCLAGIIGESFAIREYRSGGGTADFEQLWKLLADAAATQGFGLSAKKQDKSWQKGRLYPPAMIDKSVIKGKTLSPGSIEKIERIMENLAEKANEKALKILGGFKYEFFSIADVYISEKPDADALTGDELRRLLKKYGAEKKKIGKEAIGEKISEMEKKHFARIEKLRKQYLTESG